MHVIVIGWHPAMADTHRTEVVDKPIAQLHGKGKHVESDQQRAILGRTQEGGKEGDNEGDHHFLFQAEGNDRRRPHGWLPQLC